MIVKFKMNRVLVALTGVAVMGLAQAQTTASVDAAATATVVAPIAITKSADLGFGTIVPGATAGTIAVAAADNAGTAGGGASIHSNSSTTAAAFAVTGEKSYTYAITLPTTVTLSHSTDNTKTMSAGSFTVVAGAKGSVSGTTGTLDATDGQGDLKVGATLSVGANQTAGSYTGTVSVSVAYN